MKKRRAGFKLNRNSQQRSALLKSLMQSLILRESITTTVTKAKAMRPLFERLLTTAKDPSLAASRSVLAVLQSPKLVKKLFSEIAPRYTNTHGGYTSLTLIGNRTGDNASIAKLALTKRTIVAKQTKFSAPIAPTPAKKASASSVAPQLEKFAPVKAAPKLVRRTGKRGDK